MVELMVGLVALLVLLGALLQLTSLTTARIDAMAEARRDAGTRAMSTLALSSGADYIRYWEEGPDERRYSVDDTFTEANGAAFTACIVDRAGRDPAAWQIIESAPRNAIRALHDTPFPATQFGLVDGTESVTVPLLPVVKHLIYNADSITLDCQVWMPWAREIY